MKKKREIDGRTDGRMDGRADKQTRRDRVHATEESQKKRDGARFDVGGAGGWAQRTR